MPYLPDASLDALLNYVQDSVTTLYICSALPANYTEASSTYKLGTKASPTVAEPSDRGGGGRECVITAITDGTVDSSGDASHWALCKDSATSELLAAGDLASTQTVTASNTFTLAQFAFGVPDAV
jgi:hypothetical protein